MVYFQFEIGHFVRYLSPEPNWEEMEAPDLYTKLNNDNLIASILYRTEPSFPWRGRRDKFAKLVLGWSQVINLCYTMKWCVYVWGLNNWNKNLNFSLQNGVWSRLKLWMAYWAMDMGSFGVRGSWLVWWSDKLRKTLQIACDSALYNVMLHAMLHNVCTTYF